MTQNFWPLAPHTSPFSKITTYIKITPSVTSRNSFKGGAANRREERWTISSISVVAVV
jgi:hypothetical protein